MSFSKSFYADQAPTEPKQQNNYASAAIPATTPIAENPLSPSQIQEAVRLYRSMMSNSAPQSPARRPSAAQPQKPVVHSNYYGGGPTDIPQSYLVNYNQSSTDSYSIPTTPIAPPQQHDFVEQELVAKLENLEIVQQEQKKVEVVKEEPHVKRVAPKNPVAKNAYGEEESGYCFNQDKKNEEYGQEASDAYQTPAYSSSTKGVYFSAPKPFQATGPSEYIGMSNDNRFIYDAKRQTPSYNNYTLVNKTSQPVVNTVEEEHGTTTTEDITQVPASPAPHSRFRGLIQSINATPTRNNASIVVERVEDSPQQQQQHYQQHYHGYDAFVPINNMPTESEYQLPVLNDLASCIENY